MRDGILGGLHVAPPEYVVVRKLEFYREGRSAKHLRDIRSMLAVSPELAQPKSTGRSTGRRMSP